MNKKISWSYFLVVLILLDIYVLPTYYLETKGIPFTNIFLAVFLLATYVYNLGVSKKMSSFEFVYCILIIILIIYKKTLTPITLLSPVIVYRNKKLITHSVEILEDSNLLYIALIFTFFYSFLYGLQSDRIVHTGLYEVNSSGLAVLWLGLFFLKKKKMIGNIVLLFGLLSLSRNYFLGVIICLFFSLKKIKKIIKKRNLIKYLTFQNIIFISTIILYLIGKVAEFKYSQGLVTFETSFKGRLDNFFDTSNYLRFTVNVYLIDIFLKKPLYLFTGINNEIFKTECKNIAHDRGQLYVGNNPHNFMLSYSKIYGAIAILDVYLINKLFKNLINDNNFFILICVSVYCIFLSVGVNGYWLFYTIMLLELYKN